MKMSYTVETAGAAYESLAEFPYGQSVNITDGRGGNHNCYCIDVAIAERIWSLPMQKSPLKWEVLLWRGHQREGHRGFLGVSECEHGFLANRKFRLNGQLVSFTLAHQLTSTPILLPSIELAMAAAGHCFPKPNRALGFLWWTYPDIPTR